MVENDGTKDMASLVAQTRKRRNGRNGAKGAPVDVGPKTGEALEVEVDVPSEPATKAKFYLLMYQGSSGDELSYISNSCVGHVRRLLAEQIGKRPPGDVEIDLWLESSGGSAHAAYKLMLLLRAYADRVTVVVPDYAKSAATLMVLGADKIFMGPAAELGPLDAQIEYEQAGITISALDIARSVEHLATTAVSMALTGGAAVLRTTGLSRKDTVNGMLGFVSSFMQPIVSQLDPTMIHQSSSQLRVASEYAERLLEMRTPDPADRSPATDLLPQHLVERYPAHGFVICREEARKLGLPVYPVSEYPDVELVNLTYDAFDNARGAHVMALYDEAGLQSLRSM